MARVVFLDEKSLVKKLKKARDFDIATSVVGIPDDKIVVAEQIDNIVKMEFEELIHAFPASTFFDLRDNHEKYLKSVCGSEKVNDSFPKRVQEKQSPVRRRLF